MEKIETLSEAFDYVNQRYVFDKQHYPMIEKLTDDEKTFFALKHTLLHMQKNISRIIFDEKFGRSPMHYSDQDNSFVKIIVNIIKASDLVGLPPSEIINTSESSFSGGPIADELLFAMEEIAKYCEAFDHKDCPQDLTEEVIYCLKIKEALKKTWRNLISISDKYQSRVQIGMTVISMDAIFNNIPRVMKS